MVGFGSFFPHVVAQIVSNQQRSLCIVKTTTKNTIMITEHCEKKLVKCSLPFSSAGGNTVKMVLLVMALLNLSLPGTAGAPINIDLTKFTSGADGTRFIPSASESGLGITVSQIGDHNGDGYPDFVLGSFRLTRAVIVMKRNTAYAEVNVANVVSDQYFRVVKGPSGSETGICVGGIGDINGDSFADVIVGNSANAGYGYVIFGRVGPFTDISITTATWPASSLGFTIVGAVSGGNFMFNNEAVRGLGDVNGDGVDDFAVSMSRYQGTSSKYAPGVVFVIYGKKTPSFTTINLLPASFGSSGVYYTGAAAEDYLGRSIRPAGDFNGDGIPDFLMSATSYDPVVNGVTRNGAGAVYLMHGSKTALATMDMSTFVTGSLGVRFLGAIGNDQIGYSVNGVGDINGDGLDDIAFGSQFAKALDRDSAGIVYVIYGTTVAFTADIDLLGFVASSLGFSIYGQSAYIQLCTVAPAGDINRDGVNDIFVGGTAVNSKAHVVYGQAAARTAPVDTAVDTVVTIFFTAGAQLGSAVDGGKDFNGDGYPDLLLGARGATVTPEGGGASISSAGAVWMISGASLTSLGNSPSYPPTASPTARPSMMPSAVPTAVPTMMPSLSPDTKPTTAAPTAMPTAMPTAAPTAKPSWMPTNAPTAKPSMMPSAVPSVVPTMMPSASPTTKPSWMPTAGPTMMPSAAPTTKPSWMPTAVPTMMPSAAPTAKPTTMPTAGPTMMPSAAPTAKPSWMPTAAPTAKPTTMPTAGPTMMPSAAPTAKPSWMPTAAPTAKPSWMPTAGPTMMPSAAPTVVPTMMPSAAPTAKPSWMPTAGPTMMPTAAPTAKPSWMPTAAPTVKPTAAPTDVPTMMPSAAPTAKPTAMPTAAPTCAPSADPTFSPTLSPTPVPTFVPTARPTIATFKDYEVVVDVAQEVYSVTKASYDAQKVACNLTIQHSVSDALPGVPSESVTDIVVEEVGGGRTSGGVRRALADRPVFLKYKITVRDPVVTTTSLRAQLVQATQEGKMDAGIRTYSAQFGATTFNNVTVALPQVTSSVVQRDASSQLTGVQIALLVIGIIVGLALLASILWFALLQKSEPPAPAPRGGETQAGLGV